LDTPEPSDAGPLDIDLARLIDAVCRRYEADWRADARPPFDTYLAEVPSEARPALRAELEALERELRQLEETVAREEPVAAAEAPTIAPPEPPTHRTPGEARLSMHEDATVAPGDPATLDQGPDSTVKTEDRSLSRVRYFGDYEILREIARGGMGVVFQARQVSLNRIVALKMILAGQLANDTDVKRFYTEAEAAANLDHPGIVPIYEVGQHEGQHYFSMGFVEGQSLSHRLAGGPMPPSQAAELIVKVADAIEYAHQRGVIHRDLKPANILLDRQGNPRITDFGLAKKLTTDSGLTGSGQIMGTPSYMPPEQAGGKHGKVGPASDVYALGATLYALVTGRPPFQAATPMDTVIQLVSDEPVPPRRLNPSIPLDVETICLKCLEKQSDERYASAAAFAADLRRFLAGEPIAARPVTHLERAAKWARRKPTLAAAYTLGLLTLVLGGLGGTALWQWRAAERARDTARSALDEARRQRDIADVARTGAIEAQAEAERQREKFERFDYGRTIQVAHQEWRENNVPATLALLDSARPEPRGWEWRYVHRLCHSEVLTLEGHTGGVLSASFSPDGTRIVTASVDGTVRVWDAKSGAVMLTFKGHNGRVLSASFSPDGARVVTASDNSPRGPLGILELLRGDRSSGSAPRALDHTAKVWDARSGAVLLTLKGHTGDVGLASFSPDGAQVLSAGGGAVKVWDTKSGAEVVALKGHTHDVGVASFSPDGARIVTVSSDGTVKVWDAKSGAVMLTFKGHNDWVHSAAFSPDGSRIVTASQDKTAKVWDATSGAEVLIFKGHTNLVRSAAFSPDGTRVVTASDDRTARVWDAKSGAEVLTFKGHTNILTSAMFSPDGARVVTASGELSGTLDRTVKVWDAKTDAEVLTLKGHTWTVNSASFSPDGKRVVTGDTDQTGIYGTAKVWDAKTGAEVLTLKGHTGKASAKVLAVSFSPDGSQVVTGSGDGIARVWDAKSGAEVFTLKGHIVQVISASFSPDGERILTESFDGTAKVWDAKSRAAILTLKVDNAAADMFSRLKDAKSAAIVTPNGLRSLPTSATFSPDGAQILTASLDGTAKVWDAKSGTEVLTLKGHTGAVWSASFSPDGERIVTTSADQVAKVWDARSGAQVLTLKGHTNNVRSATFSPDGTRIVTASDDRTARVWDAKSGAEVLTLKGHAKKVNSASFSLDGTRVVTASDDGTASIWDAGPPGPEMATSVRTSR
jgi:WD40 repeat protein